MFHQLRYHSAWSRERNTGITKKVYGGPLCRPGLTMGEVITELSLLISVEMGVLLVALSTRSQEPKLPEPLARLDGQPRGFNLLGVVNRVSHF